MRRVIASVMAICALLATGATQSIACDLCAIYAASQARGEAGKGLFGGLAEQWTHFGTLQQDGLEVPNPAGQRLDSSITQLLLGYNFNEQIGLQLNAPFIYRDFRRTTTGGLEQGNLGGPGDMAVLATYRVYQYERKHSTFSAEVFGGIKFPTGSTSRLAEELYEVPVAPFPSGIHGHDLTLGSGSYDGLLGATLFGRLNRAFVSATVQYAIRSTGDYDYRFANDLVWYGGPGFYAILQDDLTLSVQALVSGESKGRDTFRGTFADDTGITSVYLGPQAMLTWKDKLSAQVAVDLPVSEQNTGLQIVPDYRVRAAVTWRF